MKVLVVDDHILFREGLTSLLTADNFFQVVGQAGSMQEAIDRANDLQPDLILMDFSLPDGNGAEATEAILAKQPQINIVFLTMYETDEKLFAAINSGAKGYLLKNVSSEKLVMSLKSVDKGEAAISPSMTMRILEEFSRNHNGFDNEVHPIEPSLSDRELDVLQQISSGASNEEIASSLFLSVNTVKHHVHSILSKLKLENRKQAVQYARQVGLLKHV
jgi:DNA-binding NarL/FixJ family response regulator